MDHFCITGGNRPGNDTNLIRVVDEREIMGNLPRDSVDSGPGVGEIELALLRLGPAQRDRGFLAVAFIVQCDQLAEAP